MMNYDEFLSQAAAGMQESAIRRMGAILAQNRDLISFAPGYPAPETFPWADFSEIARELLSGSHGSALQYGATRGFSPLLEMIAGIMQGRGIAPAMDRLLVTTGSQQGLDLVARVLLDPGDVVLVELPAYTGAITAFRNVRAHMEGVPQEIDGIDLAALDEIHERLVKNGRRVRFLYVVPNFQNPTGLLMGLRKRLQLARVGRVPQRPHRRRRSLSRAVLRGLGDGSDVRPMKADDARRPRHLLEQLLEDAGAGLPRRLDRRAGADCRQARDGQAGGRLCARASSISGWCTSADAAGFSSGNCRCSGSITRDKRDVMVAAFRRESDSRLYVDRSARRIFPVGDAAATSIDADRLLDRAVRAWRGVCGGQRVLRQRSRRQPHSAVVLRSRRTNTFAKVYAGLAEAIREELREREQAAPSARASTGR